VGIGTTAPSANLHLFSNITGQDTTLLVESRNIASLTLNGDRSNLSGEPGGALINMLQDGVGTRFVISTTQTANTLADGTVFTGVGQNDLVIGSLFSSTTHFGTSSYVHTSLESDGDMSKYAYGDTTDITLSRANGTALVPTATALNDTIGGIYGRGRTSTGWTNYAARMVFIASENHTTSSQGMRIVFSTTANGTTTRADRMTITDSGRVGIGSTTPTQGLLVVNGTIAQATITSGSYFSTGTFSSTLSNAASSQLITPSVSIFGTGYIWAATGFVASSDRRIKKDIVEIDDDVALQAVRRLKPSMYKYVDTVSRTDKQVYGFIAQEVQEVLPYAVTQRTESIPDIYKVGILSDGGMLKLPEDCNINIDDKLRILTKDGKESFGTVTSVMDSQTVLMDIKIDDFDLTEPQEVFVYGREVNDFHVLQKEAIFTVGVSAIQELDRQQQLHKTKLQELQTEIAYQNLQIQGLQNENAQLKAKLEAVLAHLNLSV
jgi:hypothetical protein